MVCAATRKVTRNNDGFRLISTKPAPASRKKLSSGSSSSAASSGATSSADSAGDSSGTSSCTRPDNATSVADQTKVSASNTRTSGTPDTASSSPAIAGPTKNARLSNVLLAPL